MNQKKVHVVIQTAFIGDLFLSIPFLNRLKKNNPDHQIVLVCKNGLSPFFLNHKIVDQAFEIKKNDSGSYKVALNQINQLNLDHVYCLHRSIRSQIFCFRLNAKQKFGFTDSHFFLNWKKIIFNKTYVYNKSWPEVIRQFTLLTLVDTDLKKLIESKDWTYLNYKNIETDRFPQIPIEFEFLHQQDHQKSNQKNRKIALFPGSVWATKKWTIEGFSALTQALLNLNYQVFIMGGSDDLADSEFIYRQNPKAQMLTGQMSLKDSTAFLATMDLIICNDSAPAHMAAFFQRPVLAVFGPTVLDFGFRPWNNKSQVVQTDLACRPCGPHGHKQCPLGHHQCMKNITAESVFERAKIMLEE